MINQQEGDREMILEKNMRDWLLECFEDEFDQETINELTYEQLVRSINRYYDGGMQQFIECGGLE